MYSVGPRLGDVKVAEGNRGQVVAHRPGAVPAILGIAVAELAVGISTPAFHTAVVQLRARVLETDGDELRRPTRPQVDRG